MQNSETLLTAEPPRLNQKQIQDLKCGLERGAKFSPAREKTDDVIALYVGGIGHKTIAKQLSISPRITREILIESGVYQPGKLKSLNGGPFSRKNLAIKRIAADSRRRAKQCVGPKMEKPRRPKPPTSGMTNTDRFRWLYQNDEAFHILALCRRRMRKMIHENGIMKSGKTRDLLGASGDEVRAYIASQFKRGMTWTKLLAGEIELDHKIPCASFNLTDPRQQRQCFHFTNLQPLWKRHNQTKGDKLERHEQYALI